MTAELRTVREESERLQSSVSDLKARSMRDNLEFAVIPEDNLRTQRLQEFRQRKYKLDYEIRKSPQEGEMERVQRTPSENHS